MGKFSGAVNKFNKKFKVGDKISYKDSKGATQTGTLRHQAVEQPTQGSIWIQEQNGKIALSSVTSKF